MNPSEVFKLELQNTKNNDYTLLNLIKKYMINGELYLETLNSKQRSFLHKFAQKYNIDHYSIGNYTNRILVLKDNQHIYFHKTYPYKFREIIDKYSKLPTTVEENDKYEDDEYEDEDKDEYDEGDEYDEDKDDEDYEDDKDEDEDEEDEEDEGDDSESEYTTNYSGGTLSKLTLGEKTIYIASLVNIIISLGIYLKL